MPQTAAVCSAVTIKPAQSGQMASSAVSEARMTNRRLVLTSTSVVLLISMCSELNSKFAVVAFIGAMFTTIKEISNDVLTNDGDFADKFLT